jgi:hypothetical protein
VQWSIACVAEGAKHLSGPQWLPFARERVAPYRARTNGSLWRERLVHYRPRDDTRYWQDPAVIDRELLAFIAAHGEPGVMPKKQALEAAGRGDLANAIARAGGQYATAQRLGLRPADTRRAPNHWADIAELERELRAFVTEPGRPQRMPSLHELIAARRFDLHYAVQRHGGVRAMAERLGWPTASDRTGRVPEPGSGMVGKQDSGIRSERGAGRAGADRAKAVDTPRDS